MASRRFFRRVARARLLIIAPVALWSLSASASASIDAGLRVTVYDNLGWNASPPLPSEEQIVGITSMSQIDWSFDSSPLFGMQEDFVVRFEGFISAPCTCEIRFTVPADDGIIMRLDDALVIDDWIDKGGGGSISAPVAMIADQPRALDLWFYENGGAAWLQAYWQIDGEWSLIPASAFMVSIPTSTTTSTTTSTSTTTTLPQTTTTESTTTTELVTTTIQESTTTSWTTTTASTLPAIVETTSTTTTSTTLAPSPRSTTTTSTTEPPVIETSTTTSTSVPESTTTTSSTTTIAPPVDATGHGMKPARLVSRALRDGVSAGQQRAVVAGAVLIAMPSAFRPSRRP